MEAFRKTVAENLIKIRTSLNMTQAQLGDELNYSDKSVSKWERGESLPDVYVLKKIADMGGVSVDYLLSEHGEGEVLPAAEKKPRRYSRLFISMTVLAGIWALAILVFVIIWLIGTISWLVFVYAVPVSLITMLVLNSVWGNKANNIFLISGIVWGIICSVYLSFIDYNWWQLFILGVPAQIIIVLAFSIRNKHVG